MTHVGPSDLDRPQALSAPNSDDTEALDRNVPTAQNVESQMSVPEPIVRPPTPDSHPALVVDHAMQPDQDARKVTADIPPPPPPPPTRPQLINSHPLDEGPPSTTSSAHTDAVTGAQLSISSPSVSQPTSLTRDTSNDSTHTPQPPTLDADIGSGQPAALNSNNDTDGPSLTSGTPEQPETLPSNPQVSENKSSPNPSPKRAAPNTDINVGPMPLVQQPQAASQIDLSTTARPAHLSPSAAAVVSESNHADHGSPFQQTPNSVSDFKEEAILSQESEITLNAGTEDNVGSHEQPAALDPNSSQVANVAVPANEPGTKLNGQESNIVTQPSDQMGASEPQVANQPVNAAAAESDKKVASDETLLTTGIVKSEDRLANQSDHLEPEEKESDSSYVLPASNRPIPKHLPKVAKSRPENARVFIGNLASEYTSTLDIVKVFHKYGELIEEPVLRRSFGFVQYSSAEAAKAAVAGEQGRIIGGIAIDLSIADNREVRKGAHIVNNTPFTHPKPGGGSGFGRGGRVRERDPGPSSFSGPPRKRRRSLSPTASRKGGVHPPQFRRQRPEPRSGIYMRILCMSPTAKSYARHCENTFRTMTGSRADVLHIVAANLGDALGKAMREQIPYVMVVASKDVEDGTCTIRTLEKTGYEKSGRGNGVIPLREAVEVCLIERGTLVPNHLAPGPGQFGAGGSAGGINSGASRSGVNGPGFGRSGMIGTAQWLTQGGPQGTDGGMDAGKPGWMSGPRAPHPSNMRMQGSGGPGGIGPMGMGGMGSAGAGAGAGGGHGFGYGGMDGGRGGYGPIGGGMGGPGPNGMNPVQGMMNGPAGRGEIYGGGGVGGVGGGFGGGQDFGRPGGQMGYGMGGYGQAGPADPRLGGHGINPRMNSLGGNAIREGEYDPAAVVGGRSTGGPGGGYGDWNREQGRMSSRDMYGGGGMQGGGPGREEDGANFEGGNGQPFRGGGYGVGQGFGGDRIPPNGGNDGMQMGMYGGIDGGGAGGNAGGGNISGSRGQGYESGSAYGGSYGAYGGGMGYRGNEGNMNVGHGRIDDAPDIRRYGQDTQGGYGDGPSTGYGDGNMNMYGGRDQGRGDGWGNVDGGRGSGGMGMHGGMGAPGGNGPYGGGSGGGGRGSHGMGVAPDVRRGTTMDFGKITNLISAFQQQKQQAGAHQQQVSANQQQPTHGVAAGRVVRPSRDGPAAVAGRLSAGNMSQILADPAVQQALQNIGGAGRLAGGGGGGSGGGGAQGQGMGMWHGGGGGGSQPSVGMGGIGRGGSGRVGDGRGGHQMGSSGQGYYG